MFSVDSNLTDLKIREKNLSKVMFSMNIHQVASPDLSVEDARSCVFFFRDGGKVLAYVGLYFIRTGLRLYYTHSSNPFPEEKLDEIESEARAFAEDLGAMLDELDFSKLSHSEQNKWFDEQEALWDAKKQESETESAPAEKSEEPAVSTSSARPVLTEQSVVWPAEPTPNPQPAAAVPAASTSEPAPILQVWPEPETAPATQAPAPAQSAPVVPVVAPVVVPPTPVVAAPIVAPVVAAPVVVPPTPVVAAPIVAPVVAAPVVVPPTPVVTAPIAAPSAAAPVSAPSSTKQSPSQSAPRKTAPAPAPIAQIVEPDQPVQPELTIAPRPERVLEDAVKAGVVKAPKAQLKKDIRSVAGVVSRDKEALARLLASF